MKHRVSFAVSLILAALLAGAERARAQSTAFTYQGNLQLNGSAASGAYDFQFGLFTNSSGGSAVSTITSPAVGVTNGLFTTVLNFGNAFNGSTFWLDIAIRPNGSLGSFTELSTRQPVTASPYALYAPSAGTVTGVLASTNLPASPVFTGNVTAANFVGNGAGLTNLPTSLTSSNYLFAYDNSSTVQTAGVNNYTTIGFNTPAQGSGWTPSPIGPSYQFFTAANGGLYLIQYSAELQGTPGRTASFRAIVNTGISDLAGSEVSVTLGTNGTTAVSKTFMASINAGDQFKLQFLTDGSTVTLTNSLTTPIKPAVSMTLIRIN